MKGRTYYKFALAGAGADQRISSDLREWSFRFAELFGRTFKPLLDVVLSTTVLVNETIIVTDGKYEKKLEEKSGFSESIFGMMTYLIYGISDPLCGMKGYRMSFYEKIGYFDSYNSIGTEMLLKGLRSGLGVKQIQLTHNSLRDGKSKLGGPIESNIAIMKALTIALYKESARLFS